MILVIIKNILKRFILLDGYCKKCGKCASPVFHVSDNLWTEVTAWNYKKTYCINCFDRMARNKGIYITWEGIKEGE